MLIDEERMAAPGGTHDCLFIKYTYDCFTVCETALIYYCIMKEEFVYNTCDIIRDEAVPTSIDRMIYFVNFTRHDRQSPSYVNLIRDPADYVLSRYKYRNVSGAITRLTFVFC